MFSILKLIIWLAGVAVVLYLALPYFGYEVNLNYWNERKAVCQEQLNQCRKDLIQNGLQGAKGTCDFQCVDPSILIEKQKKESDN